jgi:hypothetical protein
MKKLLASILAGVSLAYGSFSRGDDLPTQIEPKDGKYYTTDQVTLEVKDMGLRKVIDRSQSQPIFMKGKYTPEGEVSIAYSTQPFEEKTTRPKQGFANTSRIYLGIPEGVEVCEIKQNAEHIGNFDQVTTTKLKPLEETKYAKTFLKMGNNGIEKLREYDPLQKASSTLNDSIFLLTGTDLNLEDKLSVYGGLQALSDHLVEQEKNKGRATFKGELELKEIPLFPLDSVFYQPSETKREINFRIKPGTYTGEKIPFTVYHKLILGTEPTKGIGKLEAFFSGEIDNPNGQGENNQEEWVIFTHDDLRSGIFINQKQNTAKICVNDTEGGEITCTEMKKISNGYELSLQQNRDRLKNWKVLIKKENNQWYGEKIQIGTKKEGKQPLTKIGSLSEFFRVTQMIERMH